MKRTVVILIERKVKPHMELVEKTTLPLSTRSTLSAALYSSSIVDIHIYRVMLLELFSRINLRAQKEKKGTTKKRKRENHDAISRKDILQISNWRYQRNGNDCASQIRR